MIGIGRKSSANLVIRAHVIRRPSGLNDTSYTAASGRAASQSSAAAGAGEAFHRRAVPSGGPKCQTPITSLSLRKGVDAWNVWRRDDAHPDQTAFRRTSRERSLMRQFGAAQMR
jgi:hypothetical protein